MNKIESNKNIERELVSEISSCYWWKWSLSEMAGCTCLRLLRRVCMSLLSISLCAFGCHVFRKYKHQHNKRERARAHFVACIHPTESNLLWLKYKHNHNLSNNNICATLCNSYSISILQDFFHWDWHKAWMNIVSCLQPPHESAVCVIIIIIVQLMEHFFII